MPGLLYTYSPIHSFFRSTQQLDHVSCCGISGAEGENGTKWAWRHRRSCQWIKRKEMFDFFSEGRLEKHLVGCRFNGTPHKSRKNKKIHFWCDASSSPSCRCTLPSSSTSSQWRISPLDCIQHFSRWHTHRINIWTLLCLEITWQVSNILDSEKTVIIIQNPLQGGITDNGYAL